jgi:hypothetical protein
MAGHSGHTIQLHGEPQMRRISIQAGRVAEVVQCLPSKSEALSLTPNIAPKNKQTNPQPLPPRKTSQS